MIKVGRVSAGPMKTNIDPCLQEEESTLWLIEELMEIHVDPNEPSRVVKIGKCLSSELAEKLMDF